MKPRILFIGEHPKGHEVAFDPSTLSGKRLRAMVAEAGVDAEYMNLWDSEHQQASGEIASGPLARLIKHKALGGRSIALGRRVHKALVNLNIEVQYLPHPAARRKKDIENLRNGIRAFKIGRVST